MAGLLSGVLPFVFSQADRLKRHAGGLLADPAGTMAQTAGLLGDNHREQQGLMAKAFGDKKAPFRVTDEGAMMQAAQAMLNGPLGMAPAGIFAGVGAKTANAAKLAEAQKRIGAGDDPARVWAETGWGKGPDGKWRFEIDDSGAEFLRKSKPASDDEFQAFMAANKLLKEHEAEKQAARVAPGFSVEAFYRARPGLYESVQQARGLTGGYKAKYLSPTPKSGAADEFLEHDRLFNAYPDLQRTSVTYDVADSGGAYMPSIDAVRLGGGNEKSILLHELQHALQKREGFAKGGGYADAAAGKYENLLGEAEARLTQSRLGMDQRQRAAAFPWAAQYFREATGTPLGDLIIR